MLGYAHIHSMPSIINKLRRSSNNSFFSNLSLLALMLLWFLNPTNKLIVVVLFLLCLVLWLKSKDLRSSLIATFLISSVLFIGKTHYLKLLDIDFQMFPELKQLYPNGIVASITISAIHLVSFFMAWVLVRDLLLKKIRLNLKVFDSLLLLFFMSSVMSSLFFSKRIYLSLYYSFSILPVLIFHFFLKFYGKGKFLLIYSVITILILFEGYISIAQFIISSPLGKNIELEKFASQYGQGADESYFTFRPIGTFIHANDLATFVSLFLPLIMALLILKFEKLSLSAFISSVIIILLSLSRSVWFGLTLSLLYFFYKIEYQLKVDILPKFANKIIIFSIIFLPFFIYATPRIAKISSILQRSGGLKLRIEQSSEILALFKTSPLLGVGPGMSVISSIERSKNSIFTSFPVAIHNFYLLTLVEGGLFGLFLLLSLIYFSLKSMLFKVDEANLIKNRLKLYGLISGIFIIIIVAFFQPFFFFTHLILLYHLKDHV